MAAQPREVVLYVTQDGSCPFELWLNSLRDRRARARIRNRLDRIGLGNLGGIKSVVAGVMEFRISYGPGYRVYFSQTDSNEIILLLCGGDKKTQDKDILGAKQYWIDFQARQNEDS